MPLNVNWDVDKYKLDHECEEHWSLRKAFMERWKTYYTEERLVCLAQVFSNIEFLGCSYPLELMREVANLSRDIVMEYRQSKRKKLQRTFVSASVAAVDRAKGVKREGGVIKEAPLPKNATIAFVRQGHSVTTSWQSSVMTEPRSLLAQPLLPSRVGATPVKPSQPLAREVSASAVTACIVDRLEEGWTLAGPRGRKGDRPRQGDVQPQPAPGLTRRNRPSKRKRRQARQRELDERNADPPTPSAKSVTTEPQPSTSRGKGEISTAGDTRPSYKEAQETKGHLPGKQTSYADAAKSKPLVAVTSATIGHISASTAQLVQKELEAKLMAAMLTAKGDEGLSFQGKPVYDGRVLKLWCSNLSTLDWLKSAVEDIVLTSGERLVVKQMWEISRRVRCRICIPGVRSDTKAIGGMLRFQNPWAEVDRWLLHALYRQNENTYIVVSVPEELVPALMGHDRRLAYMLGSVYLKFQGPTGKFTETAPLKVVDQEEGGSKGADLMKGRTDPTMMEMQASCSTEPIGDGVRVSEPLSDAALDDVYFVDLEDTLSPSPGVVDVECIEDAGEEGIMLSDDGILFSL